MNLIHSDVNIKFINKLVLVRYQIIDTQVARRGRQYHRNPPYKKEKKRNKISKRK